MKSQIMAEMKQTIESLENQMQVERKEKEKAQAEVKQMQMVSGNILIVLNHFFVLIIYHNRKEEFEEGKE